MPLSDTVKTSRTFPRAAFCAGRRETHAAAPGELHRIVDQVFQRRPQPQRIADHRVRQLAREVDLGRDALGLRPGGERGREHLGETARADELPPQHQTLGIGARGIDDERGEQSEMLGRALDRRRPATLALAELRRRQQLAQREDTGQRRPDLVGDIRERRLDRPRAGCGRTRACGALAATLAGRCLHFRHRTPSGRLPRRKAAGHRLSRQSDHPADVGGSSTTLPQRAQGRCARRFG